MLTVFARTVALYIISVTAVRLMGKRQIGQLQPYEFVLALMIAELAAAPMEGTHTPLLYGVVPILGMLFFHGVETLLSLKFTWARRLLSGEPSVIIRRGEIQYKEMKRMCYTVSDLLEEIRAQGYLNIADVGTAILETNGRLSVFPHENKRPAALEDLQMPGGYEGIPLTLIVDGKIQKEHLQSAGRKEAWLMEVLHALGFACEKDVLLASLDTKGYLFVQAKEGKGNMHFVRVMDEKAVNW